MSRLSVLPVRVVVRPLFSSLLAVLFTVLPVSAQQLTFVPDDASGVYEVGERVGWTVRAGGEGQGSAQARGTYTYAVKAFGGEVHSSGTLDLASGSARIETSLGRPGTLLVEVRPSVADNTFGNRSTGGPGRVLLGAAVQPTAIQAAEPKPLDFDAFWSQKIGELEAIPMSPVVTPGESGIPGIDYASVRLNNINRARIYGQLAKPAGEGRFPAIVIYQWASPPYPLQKAWVTDRAAEGYLALNIMPHDVPHDLPQAFYDALPAMIKSYQTIGQHSRDESHFLQMYLGAYRAVEYLASRPDWDGRTMIVMGTSMGGQQSFATAGLNPRVTDLIVHVPSGADVTAALHGRAPSYPNWNVSRPEVLATARYFDTANFASRITARSLVSIGFIDETSAPAGIWSVFNQIRGPKEVAPMVDAPHNHLATPEQQMPHTTRSREWLQAIAAGRNPLAAR